MSLRKQICRAKKPPIDRLRMAESCHMPGAFPGELAYKYLGKLINSKSIRDGSFVVRASNHIQVQMRLLIPAPKVAQFCAIQRKSISGNSLC